jgi:hypothetical protein
LQLFWIEHCYVFIHSYHSFHLCTSKPFGGWTSTFFLPISSQFVDNTVPPDSTFKSR